MSLENYKRYWKEKPEGESRLPDEDDRSGSLFGAHPGSVKVRKGVGLTAPTLSDELDSETGNELER
jgi:hypothetical protein